MSEKLVSAVKVNIDQIFESDVIDSAGKVFVIPKKATVLVNNIGTLIQTEDGKLYLSSVGNWFRSIYYNRPMPQVDEFNKLQDLGLTLIKDSMFRLKSENTNGQEIRGENNVSVKKTDKTMASNIKSKKKN